jgi:general nucleoside transport system permease protein
MWFDLLASVLRLWAPVGLAALGGVVTERSGVVALHLEAALLAGAFSSVAVAAATNSAWLGLFTGILFGTVIGLLHAALTQLGRVPGVLSGVGLNLGTLGLTTFLLRGHKDASLTTKSLLSEGIAIALMTLCLGAIWFVLTQTPLGLRLRACGEKPETVRAAGLSPERLRFGALALGGAVSGLGGTLLALTRLGEFTENMTAGRGYLALAAVILGRWSPLGAALAALLFASGDALTGLLQNYGFGKILPAELLQLIPYLAALIALAAVKNKSRAPSALAGS